MYRYICQCAMEDTMFGSTGVPIGIIGYPELEGTHKDHQIQLLDTLRPPQSPTSPVSSETYPVSNPLCHENPISSIHVSVRNLKDPRALLTFLQCCKPQPDARSVPMHLSQPSAKCLINPSTDGKHGSCQSPGGFIEIPAGRHTGNLAVV